MYTIIIVIIMAESIKWAAHTSLYLPVPQTWVPAIFHSGIHPCTPIIMTYTTQESTIFTLHTLLQQHQILYHLQNYIYTHKHAHACMHAHTCTYIHTHLEEVQQTTASDRISVDLLDLEVVSRYKQRHQLRQTVPEITINIWRERTQYTVVRR